MSTEVIGVETDRGVESLKRLATDTHDSSQGTETVPRPEFVSIKVEVADESDGMEGPLDLQVCPSALVQTELQEFQVTVKQEPTDYAFADSEGSADFVLKTEQTDIHQPHTSTFFISDMSIASYTGKFECLACQKHFVNKSNLQRHLLIHTRHNVKCQLCLREFITPDQLEKHISNAHCPKKKEYECEHCKKIFRTSSNLFQHKRVHLTEKPYTCNVCNRSFAIKSSMLRHQGRSRCKKPVGSLICPVCNKEFQREFLLRSHERMHATEKTFECANCSMSFKYRSTLVRHLQLHNNQRPHSCSVCGKTFTTSGLIKPHMRMHTGEKPYVCPICQKRFSHKHNMQRHTLRHNKIKHLVCEVCHKKFPKESRLKYHMRTHMVDKRPFKCEYCPKSFSHRQNILRHYKKKHPGKVYDRPETDASIASIIWQSVLKKKKEAESEYIIPETDWPDGDAGSKIKEE